VISSSIPEWPWDLLDGYLKLDDAISHNIIPIPLDHAGNVELRIEGWNDTLCVITGTRVRLELVGEPKFIETFGGSRQ
jgi:hypothetical protein